MAGMTFDELPFGVLVRDQNTATASRMLELLGDVLHSVLLLASDLKIDLGDALDRMVALGHGSDSIRDVIAFPKTQKGTDLMSNAPGLVGPNQLAELRIRQPQRPRRRQDRVRP